MHIAVLMQLIACILCIVFLLSTQTHCIGSQRTMDKEERRDCPSATLPMVAFRLTGDLRVTLVVNCNRTEDGGL